MNDHNILIKEEPIHFGHLGAIFLCAVALIGITFMRNGFSFHSSQAVADAPQVLTYDQIYAQASAQDGQGSDSYLADTSGTAQTAEQLALVDPSTQGEVAGASTDASYPAVEDIFSPKVLGAVNINLQTEPTTTDSLKNYSLAMTALQANNDTLGILAALNTDDKSTLESASQNSVKVFQAMQKVPVPKDLEEYHKYQMFFYQSLGDMADIFSGKRPDTDMQAISEQLFSLIQKIDSMKQDIAGKYGVQL